MFLLEILCGLKWSGVEFALCSVHCASCIVHRALYIVHCAPCTVHRALCTMHCAPCKCSAAELEEVGCAMQQKEQLGQSLRELLSVIRSSYHPTSIDQKLQEFQELIWAALFLGSFLPSSTLKISLMLII